MGEEGEGAGEPAGDPPAGPPARREEQIRNALAFLTHPKVRAAPRRRRRRAPLPPPPHPRVPGVPERRSGLQQKVQAV